VRAAVRAAVERGIDPARRVIEIAGDFDIYFIATDPDGDGGLFVVHLDGVSLAVVAVGYERL
jgi:hypothetical protein